MSRGGRRRNRVRREDPSLDALLAELPDAEPKVVEMTMEADIPWREEPAHRPFKGWKADQENWLKAAGLWGR